MAILEFRSAFWKKVRTGEIGRNDAIQVMQYFKDDEPQFKWVPLDLRILQNASLIIMKYGPQGLRTLDSIQLAAALSLKEKTLICHTSDNLLKSFFEMENMTIVQLWGV